MDNRFRLPIRSAANDRSGDDGMTRGGPDGRELRHAHDR
jgi:hypothetical protein